jgi:hypothetical protein
MPAFRRQSIARSPMPARLLFFDYMYFASPNSLKIANQLLGVTVVDSL